MNNSCVERKNKAFSNSFQPAIKRVEKVWGHEEWIVNNEKYCGKKLILHKGYRCSLHYHKIKEETFYVLSGKVFLEIQAQDTLSSYIMVPGDTISIHPLMLHRFTGIENSVIIEFSTYHMEEDSYRIESSCQIDLHLLNHELIHSEK